MPLERSGTRTTTSSVLFTHAFRLGQDHDVLPAGTYVVHTHEDVYQGQFEPLYVASSIELLVHGPGRTTSHLASPADLAAALKIEDARASLLAGMSENPDRNQSASIDGSQYG